MKNSCSFGGSGLNSKVFFCFLLGGGVDWTSGEDGRLEEEGLEEVLGGGDPFVSCEEEESEDD